MILVHGPEFNIIVTFFWKIFITKENFGVDAVVSYMEKHKNSTSLVRTKSEQLLETLAAAFKSPTSQNDNQASTGTSDSGGGTLSRKSSRRLMVGASPGRSSRGSKNTHIRKSRSEQMKLDLEELSSGAALSRASSASLGLSFSFTGFTVPPDEISDSKPFSDDDIRKYIFLWSYFSKILTK